MSRSTAFLKKIYVIHDLDYCINFTRHSLASTDGEGVLEVRVDGRMRGGSWGGGSLEGAVGREVGAWTEGWGGSGGRCARRGVRCRWGARMGAKLRMLA